MSYSVKVLWLLITHNVLFTLQYEDGELKTEINDLAGRLEQAESEKNELMRAHEVKKKELMREHEEKMKYLSSILLVSNNANAEAVPKKRKVGVQYIILLSFCCHTFVNKKMFTCTASAHFITSCSKKLYTFLQLILLIFQKIIAHVTLIRSRVDSKLWNELWLNLKSTTPIKIYDYQNIGPKILLGLAGS